MSERHLYNLIIDREFVKLTPKLTPTESAELEYKILYEKLRKYDLICEVDCVGGEI